MLRALHAAGAKAGRNASSDAAGGAVQAPGGATPARPRLRGRSIACRPASVSSHPPSLPIFLPPAPPAPQYEDKSLLESLAELMGQRDLGVVAQVCIDASYVY